MMRTDGIAIDDGCVRVGIALVVLGLVATACGDGDTVDTGGPLASGLGCTELAAQVVAYSEVVDYFEAEGRPGGLDEDGDGIPCEQDFSRREIEAVFGVSTTVSTTATTTTEDVDTTAMADTTTTTTAARDETTTTLGRGEIREPSELSLIVVNATRRSGVEAATGDMLAGIGYQIAGLDSATAQDETLILHPAHLAREAEALAKTIATATLRLTPDLSEADLLAVLGNSFEETLEPITDRSLLVPGQFLAWVGGGDVTACEFENLGIEEPDVFLGFGWGSHAASHGEPVRICTLGFDPLAPIEVEVILPDGSTTVFVAVDSERPDTLSDPLRTGSLPQHTWLMQSDYQLGEYTLTSRQGSLSSSFSFELVTPRSGPFIDWLPENLHEPDSFLFALYGFEPGSVPVAVYRQSSGPFDGVDDWGEGAFFDLVSELEPIAVSSVGAAIVSVPDTLPPGDYCVSSPVILAVSSVGTFRGECQPGVQGGWFIVA